MGDERADELVADRVCVAITVLDPVEQHTVHEPEPCTYGRALRGRSVCLRYQAVDDPRTGEIADRGHRLAQLGHRADRLEQLHVGAAALTNPRNERSRGGTNLFERWKRLVGCRPLDELGGRLRQRRLEELLLAREVVVQQRLGDAGLASYLRHRELLERVLGEQLGADLDQLGPAFVDFEASIGRGAHALILASC
jgi:hypothetical protein